MIEYITTFQPGELIGLTAVVGGLICGTFTIVAVYWYAIHKVNIMAKLKADMLDRGMSAEEIRIVLEAGSNTDEA